MKCILFAGLILLIARPAIGQNVKELILAGKQQIQSAADEWNYSGMLKARNLFQRLPPSEQPDWLIAYYVAYCDYRIVNYLINEEQKDRARQYLEEGIRHLERTIDSHPGWAEAHALLGSSYGLMAGLRPISGMWLGPKSTALFKKARTLDESNPRVYLQEGIAKLHTPAIWGGGKQEALELLQKAVERFDRERPDPLMPGWGHSEAFAWIGIIEKELGNPDRARTYYQRALEINPENGWVKNRLMDELLLNEDPS